MAVILGRAPYLFFSWCLSTPVTQSHSGAPVDYTFKLKMREEPISLYSASLAVEHREHLTEDTSL